MAYNCNSSYGGNASQNFGQASYGQSLSSENIDFNALPPLPLPGIYSQQNAQSGYGQSASYGNYGNNSNCPPCPPCPSQYGGQQQQQQQQQQAYGAPNPYGGGYQNSSQQQLDVNDPYLMQQIEQIVQSLTECKRPVLRRQVITVPANCPPKVACITRRLPTPPPDVVERITVIKPPRDIVNLCIEKPCQPGPCYQQREICGKPRKPLIQPRVVQVAPRSNPCAPPPPPPCPPCPPCPPPCPPCPPCPQYQPPPQQQCPPCPPCPQYQPPPQQQCPPCPPCPQYQPPPQQQCPPCPPCPQYQPPQQQCPPCPPCPQYGGGGGFNGSFAGYGQRY